MRELDGDTERELALIALYHPDSDIALLWAALKAARTQVEALQLTSVEPEHLMALTVKAVAYDRINTPELDDFLAAVRNEALHQRERWGIKQDGGKTDADWFWLVGYLAGKALHNVKEKQVHHIITAAAALMNWHGQVTGHYAWMRPGIDEPR